MKKWDDVSVGLWTADESPCVGSALDAELAGEAPAPGCA